MADNQDGIDAMLDAMFAEEGINTSVLEDALFGDDLSFDCIQKVRQFFSNNDLSYLVLGRLRKKVIENIRNSNIDLSINDKNESEILAKFILNTSNIFTIPIEKKWSRNTGLSTLHDAVLFNDVFTVKIMLAAGFPIEIRSNLNCTPLHLACARGYPKMIKLLVNCGANFYADTGRRDVIETTPIGILHDFFSRNKGPAFYPNLIEIANFLLQKQLIEDNDRLVRICKSIDREKQSRGHKCVLREEYDANFKPIIYIVNQFIDNGDGTISDLSTGLMWQKSTTSPRFVKYGEMEKYIDELNEKELFGYCDWRMPSLPELMSLLTKSRNNYEHVYIDQIFELNRERYIGTSKIIHPWDENIWGVDFEEGVIVDDMLRKGAVNILAVRDI